MFNGVLKKMITENDGEVKYYLGMENDFIFFNSLFDKNITIELDGYSCLNCASSDEIYRQGNCKK